MASGDTYRDSTGRSLVLGSQLGKGGEGAVFNLQGIADRVAKIYLKPPSREHVEKLATMVLMADERVLRLAAWPLSTLHDRSGATVGFVMPKVNGYRPVFELYGPKLRLREFPKADWRFLIAAAANTARAFSVIHQAGHVIGDVNHGNMVVAQDATVQLWDCDSFQITQGAKRWFCEVGVNTHQPPEMQIPSYKGVVRTPNQDLFGLAVIIFQLLCMGRHPFSGRQLGSGEPPTIEEAIQASRYAFSRDSAKTRLTPPAGTLSVDGFSSEIQAMFELAFSSAVSHGGRPTADQWSNALQNLAGNLRRCSVNHGHWHLSNLSACPWCDIEAKSGAVLFPAVFVDNKTGTTGVLLLWPQVMALRDPGPMPPMPALASLRATVSPAAKEIGIRRRKRRTAARAVAVLGVVVVFSLFAGSSRFTPLATVCSVALAMFYWPQSKIARTYGPALEQVRRDWKQLEAAWKSPIPGPSFADVRKKLDVMKQEHDALPNERSRRERALWAARQQSQLAEHLDRYQIASAKISGIGKAKIATLQAYQVFTAGDIDPIRIHNMVIPGFGPANKGKLVDWRRECERHFRFDSNRGVLQADVVALDRDIAAKRMRAEQGISAGLAQLQAIVRNVELRRRTLNEQVGELLPKLAQITVDAASVGA